MRALERTAAIERGGTTTFPDVIDGLADRLRTKPALVGRAITLSYRELTESSNRYARWALAQGYRRGDVVCLLLENCPQYMAIWIGLNRVGIVVALLNTNLSGELLAHSIRIVSPRAVIAGHSLSGALRAALPFLPDGLRCWTHGSPHATVSTNAHQPVVSSQSDLQPMDEDVTRFSGERIAEAESAPPLPADRALFIYTSGTTGLPKAAVVSHYRIMQWTHWFAGMMDTGPDDRMYDCLPMYHSVGGIVATGATLVGGGAVILRERFSARDFWRDLADERCTLFQYIGELCRYLVASAPHPDDTRHTLRLACGNGLRPEVWETFQSRFRIPQILEYYASTEGSFSLYNCEGRTGAIGRIPPFLSHRMPVALVKFDPDRNEPLRDASGRCVRCAPNEVGEAIGQLRNPSGAPSSRFEGYADEAASRQKVLHDVFAAGDAWYRTGDLMRRDEQGFFYFVDRTGDTFRWKGENVSTSEVGAVIAECPGVEEAVVYGVLVPGADGRAGMAALVVRAPFDLMQLRRHLVARLPDYARPLFVRIVGSIELTGTFKLRKQHLANQGFDSSAAEDPIYFDDRSRQEYVLLDASLLERIRSGGMRL